MDRRPLLPVPALFRLSCLSVCSFVLAAVTAAAAQPPARGQQEYEKKILPVLEQYCFDCHADGVEKGKFTFDKHDSYPSLLADLKLWDHVRQMVSTHVMPPAKKEAPSLAQRDEVAAWIDANVFWFDPQRPDPGHITLRRLNRSEYNNTVRDALLIDMSPADEFPPDDTGYGYDNIGDVLTISPLLMEKYLRAARKIAAEALKVTAAEHAHLLIGAGKFWNQKGSSEENDGLRWMHNEGEIATKLRAPSPGTYRLTLKAGATQAGDEPAKIKLSAGDKELGVFEIRSQFKQDGQRRKGFQEIVQEATLPAGETKLTVAFINDFQDPKAADPDRRDRNVVIDEVQLDGPFELSAPRVSPFLKWLARDEFSLDPGLDLSGEDFEKGEGDTRLDNGSIEIISNGHIRHPLVIAEAGEHRFTIKAGALQAGKEPARFEVRIAGRTVGSFEVTAKNQAPQWFNCNADLPAGRHELQVHFLNDFWDEQTKADRNLWVHEVFIRRDSGKAGLNSATIPSLVQRMGERLFRRPLTADQQGKWTTLAQSSLADGAKPLEALGYTLEGMLVSPAFLYRGGCEPAGGASGSSALIDEFSLASRLSYFLWSSLPDERLLQLAAKGELRKNLAAEVKRMIQDWKCWRLTENFAGQWLQLRDMDSVSPSTRRFPEFKGGIAYSMKRETQMFFDHILRGDRSVIEFLNADYTFVNGTLARYYGIQGPKSGDRDKFEKVSLAGTPRGGVLTHGSILTLTSTPTRTNIVRRGKFFLENILGTPPPPVPGDAPPLNEEKIRFERLTLRQQFEAHRADASCAGCHAFLDPMGFALESYDAVGRWRDRDHDQPVDPSGQLIRGQKFASYAELRDILVRDMSGQFVKSLAENLLIFALGRGLEYHDRPAIGKITAHAEKNGCRMQEIILAVCESAPFQRMRAP